MSRTLIFLLASVDLLSPCSALSKDVKLAVFLSKGTSEGFICAMESFLKYRRIGDKYQLKVDIVDYDNDVGKAMVKAREIASSGYQFVIGPRTSQEVLVTAPIFERAGIGQIVLVASHPDITAKWGNTVRIVANSERYSYLMAKYIATNVKPAKIAIVTNVSQPYSTFYRDELPKNLKAFGWKGDSRQFDIIDGFSDYQALAKKISAYSADLIYAPLYSIETADLYAALAKANHPVTIMTHAGMFDAREVLAKHYDEKIQLIFNGIWDKETLPPSADLKAALKECEERSLTVRSVAMYDSLDLLTKVISDDLPPNAVTFRERSRKVTVRGFLGPLKLDRQGDPLRDMVLYRLEKGGFKLMTRVDD